MSSKHKVLNGQLSTFSSDYPRGGGVTVAAALPRCSRPQTHQQCFPPGLPPGCRPDGPARKTSKGRRSKGTMTRCPNHLRPCLLEPLPRAQVNRSRLDQDRPVNLHHNGPVRCLHYQRCRPKPPDNLHLPVTHEPDSKILELHGLGQ